MMKYQITDTTNGGIANVSEKKLAAYCLYRMGDDGDAMELQREILEKGEFKLLSGQLMLIQEHL